MIIKGIIPFILYNTIHKRLNNQTQTLNILYIFKQTTINQIEDAREIPRCIIVKDIEKSYDITVVGEEGIRNNIYFGENIKFL